MRHLLLVWMSNWQAFNIVILIQKDSKQPSGHGNHTPFFPVAFFLIVSLILANRATLARPEDEAFCFPRDLRQSGRKQHGSSKIFSLSSLSWILHFVELLEFWACILAILLRVQTSEVWESISRMQVLCVILDHLPTFECCWCQGANAPGPNDCHSVWVLLAFCLWVHWSLHHCPVTLFDICSNEENAHLL